MTKGKATFRLEGEDATAAAFRSALGRAQGFSKQASTLFKTAFAGISVAAVANLGRQAIQLGDDLNKAAIKAGVSGRAISELAYAAKQSDIDLGSLSNSLRFMQTNLSKAGSGSKEATAALTALGLSLSDLKGLDADRQFELIADRISQLTDPADRARAATELFGRAGADLLPMFEQGAAGIRAAREEADRLGQSFSDEQIKRLADADDAIKRMTGSFMGMATTLTAYVAPGLAQFFDNITAITTGDKIGKLKEQIDFLERMKGRSFVAAGYGDIGTGFFTAEEGAKKLAELKEMLRIAEGLPRIGRRGGNNRGPGLPGFGDEIVDRATDAAKQAGRSMADVQAEIYEDLANDTRRELDQKMGEINRDTQDNLDDLHSRFEKWKEATGETIAELSPFADQAARNMQDAFADFLFDPFEGGIKGMLKSFVDILRRMVAEAAAAKIFEALGFGQRGSGSGSGGLLGGLGNVLQSITGIGGPIRIPGRAAGGPVTGGFPYIVGERGPELFVPRASGSIVPNGRMGGVTYAPVYNFSGTSQELAQFRAYVDQKDRQTIAEMASLIRGGAFA